MRALLHQRRHRAPAVEEIGHGDFHWVAGLAAIVLGPIQGRAAPVDHDHIRAARPQARPGLQLLVLDAIDQGLDAGLVAVLRKERFTLLAIGLREHMLIGAGAGTHDILKIIENLAQFLLCHRRPVAGQAVLHALHDLVKIHIDFILAEIARHLDADRVTDARSIGSKCLGG